MAKLLSAFLFLLLISSFHANVFASSLNCKTTSSHDIPEVQTIRITNQSLFINETIEIPLSKTLVNCGHFRKKTRLDGNALGYQVILKTCSSDVAIEGHLIDSVNSNVAIVKCDQKLK